MDGNNEFEYEPIPGADPGDLPDFDPQKEVVSQPGRVDGWRVTNPGAVFSDSLETELIELGRQSDAIEWRIGRITLTAWEQIEKRGYRISKMGLYKHVAELTGKSERSIRAWVAAVGFFPPEVWEEFSHVPFSHFQVARSLGPDLWREALEVSARSADGNGGRVRSAEWLEEYFLGRVGGPPEPPPLPDEPGDLIREAARAERAGLLGLDVGDIGDVPQVGRGAAVHLVRQAERMVDVLAKITTKLPADEILRGRVVAALNELGATLREIGDEIRTGVRAED